MKTETLRVRNVVDAYAFLGAWLRTGEDIGWLAAGTMPNSPYRMPLVYLFLTCVFCYSCSFLFVVFCVFVFFFCSHWSLVDVPLIFFCPADHVPDWQPRVLLGMVEARSVNVKKTTTTTTTIEALLSSQPMIPPGCSEGLDVFSFSFKNLQYVQHIYNDNSVSQY